MQMFSNKQGKTGVAHGGVERVIDVVLTIIIGIIGMVIIANVLNTLLGTLLTALFNLSTISNLPLANVLFGSTGAIGYIIAIIVFALVIRMVLGLGGHKK